MIDQRVEHRAGRLREAVAEREVGARDLGQQQRQRAGVREVGIVGLREVAVDQREKPAPRRAGSGAGRRRPQPREAPREPVEQRLAGEVNLNNVTRGALQSATIGYWIDRHRAGHGYIAEGVAVVLRFAFDDLHLHRVEICIVPRNANSRRVMEKLQIRDEGIALRFLEINGTWEDHVRYAITAEEWHERRDELVRAWVG